MNNILVVYCLVFDGVGVSVLLSFLVVCEIVCGWLVWLLFGWYLL